MFIREKPFNQVRECTATALKISKNTVWRVTKDHCNTSVADAGHTKLLTLENKKPTRLYNNKYGLFNRSFYPSAHLLLLH